MAVAAIRQRREEQVSRLVAIADVAQRAILPILPSRAGAMTIAARYVSAAGGTFAGCDLYDCPGTRARLGAAVNGCGSSSRRPRQGHRRGRTGRA